MESSPYCSCTQISRLCIHQKLPTNFHVSKVLKSLVYNRIINCVLNNVTTCQFGFLPGRSTTQQLLLYLNEIFQATSQGQQTDTVYLDFCKAFDSMSHSKLLAKLPHTELWAVSGTGSAIICTTAYSVLKISSSKSDPLPMLSGVPQGSILGPLLFLLYINDMPSLIHSPNPSYLLMTPNFSNNCLITHFYNKT